MYYLVEDPTMFIFLGVVAEAVLGILLFRTGRGFILWIMLGVLAVCLTGIVGQRFIITERKRVVQTLDGISTALEANDLDGVFGYLTPDANFSRSEAKKALSLVKIESARYSQLNIEFNEYTSPWTATVTFFGVISFDDPKGMSPYKSYPMRFKLIMRKIKDRWLIESHEEVTGIK